MKCRYGLYGLLCLPCCLFEHASHTHTRVPGHVDNVAMHCSAIVAGYFVIHSVFFRRSCKFMRILCFNFVPKVNVFLLQPRKHFFPLKAREGTKIKSLTSFTFAKTLQTVCGNSQVPRANHEPNVGTPPFTYSNVTFARCSRNRTKFKPLLPAGT